ncbi:uncharacterized protein METZ01_LOCUS68465 [marine metagenome]|uniref:Uncharacterized protein n=1 Tax=marine metagenome TaxID=408172 RepID=A0A381TJC5_9ZZZZ
MRCADGTTRAVPVIDGVKVDPTLAAVEKEKAEIAKKDEKPKKVISIQDRLQGKVEDYISAVEGQADDFVDSGYKMKYDPYNHLLELGCKAAHARKMRPFYVDCYNELVDVYNKDDEYYMEAWSHLKPKYHKLMMDFYGTIVDDLDRIIKNSTAQRKPRKKKTLSAARLVKKLKYQEEFPKLKLVSINPEKIIGASELWVYNTKYNRIGVYRAENAIRGFSVKGCTIQHFDKQESVEKKARKPKDILDVLKRGTLKKKLNNLSTSENELTGRIGKDTILLGVFN